MSGEGTPRKQGSSRAESSRRRGWRRPRPSGQSQSSQVPSSVGTSSQEASSEPQSSGGPSSEGAPRLSLPLFSPSLLSQLNLGPSSQANSLGQRLAPAQEPPGQVIFDRLKKEHTDLFHEHSALMDRIKLYEEYVKRLRKRPNALLRSKTRHERKQLLDRVEIDIKTAMVILHKGSHKNRIGYAILGPWFLPHLGLGDQFYATQEEIDREVGRIKTNHAQGKEILEPIKFFLSGEGDYFPSPCLMNL